MVSGAIDALAQATSEQKAYECVSLIKERTAARAADDWQQLERLAKRYLQTCKGVHNSEDLANAQEDISTAYFELGNLTAALSVAEACISLYYASPGCHVRRVVVFLELGRLRDARAALAVAEKLVAHLITNTENDLQRDAHPLDRELNSAKLNYLRSLESRIDQLRRQVNQ